VTLLYFAWVRQTIGKSEEALALPAGIGDVRGLIAHLRARGPHYAQALGDEGRLRIAVNQRHAGLDAAIAEGDEVAIFPPITGG
jgi:molybdopterin synthase sulfur carrier subunit